MLACVCRPVTSTLPKPPTLSSAPQKRPPSMVVTCEPRITPAIDTKTAPGRPNTAELKAMALRQQQQIDTQHQLLAAKEQRLRFLKNQEIRNATAAAEGERLRRLRERVEAQESKLRRLRALRGQVDLQKTYNVTLSNDLDSIRALFSEKEKELSLAVAKVEALTKQLEELRRDRRGPLNLISTSGAALNPTATATVSVNSLNINGNNNGTTANIQQHLNSTSPAARELDKLRRELMYRNQLSLQQDARLHLQREALHQRQSELRSVDQRIYELQSRLQKKKAANLSQAFQNQMKTNQLHLMNQLNQTEHQQKLQQSQFNHQNAENINYTNNNGVVLQFVNNTHSNSTVATSNKPSHSVYPSQRIIPKGNVAAVEPYIHMPQQKPIAMTTTKQQQQQQQQQQKHQQQQQQKQQQNAKMVQDLANLKLNLLESNQKNANNTLNSNSNVNVNHIQFPESDETKLARQMLHIKQHSLDFDLNANADITDFVTSNKSDSKLQTLSYNAMRSTKANNNNNNNNNNNKMGTISSTTAIPTSAATTTTAGKIIAMSKESFDEVESTANFNLNECDSAKVEHDTNGKAPKSCLQMPSVQNEMLSAINKSVATTTTIATSSTVATVSSCAQTNVNQRLDMRTLQKSKLSMAHQIPSGNLVVPPRKPISSVAPTSIIPSMKSIIPSPRVHAVAPNVNSMPISSTSEILLDQSRPALPPKPNKNNDSCSSNESSPSANGSASSIASANRSTSLITSPMTMTMTTTTMLAASEKLANNDKQCMETGQQINSHIHAHTIDFPIKAKPLTIKKQPLSEQPRLRSLASGIKPIQYTSRRIEMPSTLLFSEHDRIKSNADNDNKMPLLSMKIEKKQMPSPADSSNSSLDEHDKSPNSSVTDDSEKTAVPQINEVVRRQRSSLSDNTKVKLTRRVSFDPLALLLDASLEGELELVQKTATQVPNPSAANDEGITALHNAICAGHFDIVKFLVEFGCDVNAQDSDGWTPLHCAASCNNLAMVKFLVESGACLFASTLSDHETPAEKCEEDEEGFDGCSEYLYSIQEKLGIMNNGEVYAVFSYEAQQSDELSFEVNDQLIILRKGDDAEREWWWAKLKETGKEGYVPRNLLGLYARIPLKQPSE